MLIEDYELAGELENGLTTDSGPLKQCQPMPLPSIDLEMSRDFTGNVGR
jgi:hypothetical protein